MNVVPYLLFLINFHQVKAKVNATFFSDVCLHLAGIAPEVTPAPDIYLATSLLLLRSFSGNGAFPTSPPYKHIFKTMIFQKCTLFLP